MNEAPSALTMVEGRVQTRSWQAQDGTKRYTTEVVADAMQLGPRTGARQDVPPEPKRETAREPEKLETIEYPEENIDPDDIPF